MTASLLNFRIYPYIMLTSCFFLLSTVLIYSVVDKLLNPYTCLMRHYAISLMMAFILLAASQLKKDTLRKDTPEICVFLGKIKVF